MVKSAGDGGQIQTVEAITAAVIILSVLALAVEATSVTPLTASFTNQHVKLELQNMGTDVLTTLDETPIVNTTDPAVPSMLRESVITWANDPYDCDWYAWNNTTYVSLTDNTSDAHLKTYLGDTLSYMLQDYGIAYNVEARYTDNSSGRPQVKNAKMIWNGDPSDNSVTVSRIVVLHDGEVPDGCIIPDISPGTKLYNTVEVRLTMWVM